MNHTTSLGARARALAASLMVGASAFPAWAGAPTFTNITATAGVAGPSHYGGHGGQWADVTGDGRPDLYVTMNFTPMAMAELFYRNAGNNAFVEEAEIRGIDDFDDLGSHGGAWGDLDNDGDYDLLNGGYDRNSVYENLGGGQFADRTATSGLIDMAYGTRGVVLFDADLDGDLDIFCNNWEPNGEPNEYYRNDGNWQFTPRDAGLQGAGGAQGVTATDLDGDGDIDLILCKWATVPGAVKVMLNSGGNFAPATVAALAVTAPSQDGVTVCDVNNDGRPDLHVTSSAAEAAWLFINNGNLAFTTIPLPYDTGFMGGFADVDNDGFWDLIYAGDDQIYLGDGTGAFAAAPLGGSPASSTHSPRCISFADIDADGDVDFFLAFKRTFNEMWRNNLVPSTGRRWLGVRLVSPDGQAGAFGADVRLYQAGHIGESGFLLSQRSASSQEGYLAQNDPVLHFGLGSRPVVDVTVTFPGGPTLERRCVPANGVVLIDGHATGGDCAVQADDTPCDDGDACTADDHCFGGACTGITMDCDDSDPCTTDSCAAGLCQSVPLSCNDGNACTSDTCVGGTCQFTALDCNDGDGCTVDTCVNGACSHVPRACNDNNACTTDGCVNGACQSLPIDCDDDLFCNGVETCVPASGCAAGAPPCAGGCDEGADDCFDCQVDADCDDGSACTGTETCDGGLCSPGTPLACDDGLFCNGAEACDAAAGCQAGTPPCAVDACDEATDACVGGCGTAADCDDGLFCNGAETCSGGQCAGGSTPCAAGTTCDEANQTCSAPSGGGGGGSTAPPPPPPAPPADGDGDGVIDGGDLCPDSDPNLAVDLDGCDANQRDSDDDGVTDADDGCPDTPAGTVVDAAGCTVVMAPPPPPDDDDPVVPVGEDPETVEPPALLRPRATPLRDADSPVSDDDPSQAGPEDGAQDPCGVGLVAVMSTGLVLVGIRRRRPRLVPR